MFTVILHFASASRSPNNIISTVVACRCLKASCMNVT